MDQRGFIKSKFAVMLNSSLLFYNSWLVDKLVTLYTRQGKKEKIENKVLDCFSIVDYYLFFEMIDILKIPVKFFSIKKRTGRHSYIYNNRIIIIKNRAQWVKAVFYLYKFILMSNSSNKKGKF